VADYAIETKNLTKKYREQTAVNNVSLQVKSGEIYGLLGRNGAGKTSIMKMILGLTSITSGDAYMFGHKIKGNQKDLYPRVGSTIETPSFYPHLTGSENLKIFAKLRGTTSKNAVEKALQIVNLPSGDKKSFSKYSLGMKQRLGIANAIMNDPEILILDEPTNGLDPIGIAEMRSFIKDLSVRQGKTIFISSHQLSEIEQLVDTIGVIHDGALLEECSMNDISRINRRHILIEVFDIKRAVLLLEEKFKITDYLVTEPQIIKIYDLSLETKRINRALIEASIDVSAISVNSGNLEEYFKSITGGAGIA
jgi:bacitracin transport system ATP-binding protein